MALFEWNDSYKVNIKIIDDQHAKLVGMINELYKALLSANPPPDMPDRLLGWMIEYAAEHFVTEEELFKTYQYPHAHEHCQEHKAFVGKIIEYHKQIRQGALTLSVKQVKFLKEWLQKHIVGSDKKYSDFLNEKGVF